MTSTATRRTRAETAAAAAAPRSRRSRLRVSRRALFCERLNVVQVMSVGDMDNVEGDSNIMKEIMTRGPVRCAMQQHVHRRPPLTCAPSAAASMPSPWSRGMAKASSPATRRRSLPPQRCPRRGDGCCRASTTSFPSLAGVSWMEPSTRLLPRPAACA